MRLFCTKYRSTNAPAQPCLFLFTGKEKSDESWSPLPSIFGGPLPASAVRHIIHSPDKKDWRLVQHMARNTVQSTRIACAKNTVQPWPGAMCTAVQMRKSDAVLANKPRVCRTQKCLHLLSFVTISLC